MVGKLLRGRQLAGWCCSMRVEWGTWLVDKERACAKISAPGSMPSCAPQSAATKADLAMKRAIQVG